MSDGGGTDLSFESIEGLLLDPVTVRPVPVCCRSCVHRDWDTDEWSGRSFWFCNMNVWIPWRKGTCKRQKKATS